MKNKVIRKGIFETNSSSTHSISINKAKKIKNEFIADENDTISIFGDEFGWGPETYNDCRTKASYLLTYAKEHNNEKLLDVLKEAIEKTTHKKVEFCKYDDTYHPWGYIDHQSFDVADKVFQSEDNIIKW